MTGSIDFHVHVYPPEIIRDAEAISKHEPYFDALTHNRVHRWATTDELLLRMERDGVDCAVIFGFAFQDMGLCRACNDYVLASMKNHPDRLRGFCIVPPASREAESEILRCAEAGMLGVGELFPEGQCIDITDRAQTMRLAGVLRETGLCVMWHTAEPVGHEYVGKGNVGPKEAAMFCANHPDVRVIFAHFGGGLWLYELMPEMRRILSHAYYDVAAWPYLYDARVMDAVRASGMLDKFLFGTDFPILDSSRYERLFRFSGLSDCEIERVTRLNALVLLQ